MLLIRLNSVSQAHKLYCMCGGSLSVECKLHAYMICLANSISMVRNISITWIVLCITDRSFLKLAEEEYNGLPSDVSENTVQLFI